MRISAYLLILLPAGRKPAAHPVAAAVLEIVSHHLSVIIGIRLEGAGLGKADLFQLFPGICVNGLFPVPSCRLIVEIGVVPAAAVQLADYLISSVIGPELSVNTGESIGAVEVPELRMLPPGVPGPLLCVLDYVPRVRGFPLSPDAAPLPLSSSSGPSAPHSSSSSASSSLSSSSSSMPSRS